LEKFLLKMELVAREWMKISSKHGRIYRIKRAETVYGSTVWNFSRRFTLWWNVDGGR
jgi:hypothetical protein